MNLLLKNSSPPAGFRTEIQIEIQRASPQTCTLGVWLKPEHGFYFNPSAEANGNERKITVFKQIL
jgi:hypothetical protein